MKKAHSNGFTLIELSIVLVIIGLIVGGVLAGRDLIRQQQVNSLVNVARDFFTKMRTFQVKYGKIPGEIDGDPFFPQLVSNNYCPRKSNTRSNNNGVIDNVFESNAVFAHLYAAGLIEIGLPQIASDSTVLDYYDCYRTGYLQGAALSTPLSGIYAVPNTGSTTNKNTLTFGAAATPVLTVLEAKALDEKLDDGMPYTGMFQARRTTGLPSAFCTTSTADTAEYHTGYLDDKTCYIFISEGI